MSSSKQKFKFYEKAENSIDFTIPFLWLLL